MRTIFYKSVKGNNLDMSLEVVENCRILHIKRNFKWKNTNGEWIEENNKILITEEDFKLVYQSLYNDGHL